jgi:signal peptidase I
VTSTRKPLARSALELVATLLLALAIAFAIQAFIVKPYRIPSASMLPTLAIGQRILVDRLNTRPSIGDVMVFHPPVDDSTCADPDEGETLDGVLHRQACDVAHRRAAAITFVKRVVGLPGDRLRIEDGRVIRNGKPEPDAYASPCDGQAGCTFPGTIVVPRGDYYMMGDNRPDSDDSRYWGPVPASWLIGTAFLTYWPPDRIGVL